MKHELNFWVIGGDMRQVKLAQLLAEDGHTVHTYALDPGPEQFPGLIQEQNLNRVGRADCVVLPMTVSAGGGRLNAPLSLSEHPLVPILDRLSPRQFLCGGRIDPETYELEPIDESMLSDSFRFVKENMVCTVSSYKGKVFAVDPPTFVELTITETDPGFAGNTATNATKPAKLETGAEIKVPLFLEEGERIKIDTRTGEYLERAKG